MFDFGWSELVVIAIVALIVIGPKELPGVLRGIGYWMGKIRRMASEFQGQFNEAMREAEMADLKKQVDELTDTSFYTPEFDALGDLQSEIEKKPETKTAEPTAEVAAFPSTEAGSVNADPQGGAGTAAASETPEATDKPAASKPVRSSVEVVPIASAPPAPVAALPDAAEPGDEPKVAGGEGRRTA